MISLPAVGRVTVLAAGAVVEVAHVCVLRPLGILAAAGGLCPAAARLPVEIVAKLLATEARLGPGAGGPWRSFGLAVAAGVVVVAAPPLVSAAGAGPGAPLQAGAGDAEVIAA